MIKSKRKIAFISLFLFIALSPTLQATYANGSSSHSRNYTNDYLVKVLNDPDVGHIVIDYVSRENENFTSLLDLTIRLVYPAHTQQMIRKADYKQATLLRSVNYDHLDFVEDLVEKRADIEAEDEDGYTVLIWSARQGHLGCVKYLLHEESADIHAKD